MELTLFRVLAGLLSVLVVSQWLWPLFRNYRRARRSGLPIVVSPFNPDNLIFMFVKVFLRAPIEWLLPLSGIKASFFGWQFYHRNLLHRQFGSIFMLVTPGVNEVWCADPAMAQLVLARRKDFHQSRMACVFMRFQGENVLTSDGDAWARQRRLIAPNLNERISEVVWAESREQANQMVDYMLRQPEASSHDAIAGVRAIAINVLGQVAYGQPKPFQPLQLPTDPEADMSYTDAISLSVELLVVSVFIKPGWLRMSMMPRALQTLGAALQRLPGLTRDVLEQERRRTAESKDGARDNIMSMLLRMSDLAKSGVSTEQSYLTEEEVVGNMFVFTAAGFDTTANTMSYAIAFMAAYPEWQAWIQEELDFVFADVKDVDNPDYATVFPKLTRTLALMFETLRLFPPLLHISRSTVASQTITTAGKTYQLEGPHLVYVNNMGLHTDAATWGPDAWTFRPGRWLTSDSRLGASQLVTPARGTFGPWGGGPRVCPGQKMSQVEFVTVMATLLRRCTLEPVPRAGETPAQARERLVELTMDSEPRLTVQMKRPKEVHLRWRQR